MPYKSKKQRRYMWAVHPDIAEKWAREGKSNVVKKRKKSKKKK